MGNTERPFYEVIPALGGYQVALMVDELYRDQPGNLRRRRVVQRKYNTFKTPLEAQELANRWNIEDGYSEPQQEEA